MATAHSGWAKALILVLILLSLVAVVAGFWFMAPFVILLAIMVGLTQRNRVEP